MSRVSLAVMRPNYEKSEVQSRENELTWTAHTACFFPPDAQEIHEIKKQ